MRVWISPVGEEIGPLKSCIQALKPLRLSSLNGFDLNWNLKVSDGRSEEGFKPVSSLGNLGFVSPIKEKVVRGFGYFLRSCSKTVGDFHLESRYVLDSGNSSLYSEGLSPLKVID